MDIVYIYYIFAIDINIVRLIIIIYKMEKTQHDIESGLSWLGSILKYIKEYGVFNIIKATMLLIVLSFSLRICFDPEYIFEKYNKFINNKHATELNNRSELDRQIKNNLPTYLYKYRADRVWIIQYHNGIMDWQHGTMRFELTRSNIDPIQNQYNDFNITWLNLPFYLKDHTTFIGDLNAVQQQDRILYEQLKKNNVAYLACILIQDNDGRGIGIFGVTWEKIPTSITKETIMNNLYSDGGEIKCLIKRNI